MLRAVPKPNHKRRIPKRINRGKFNRATREKILLRDNYSCRVCGTRATQIHHVRPKGSGKGRGVFTNGMAVCNDCHADIHNDVSKLEFWQSVFEKMYGENYYKDEWDE